MAAAMTLGEQLMRASGMGTVEQVGALLDQDVNVNSRDAIGYTGLMEASERGHMAIVVLLHDRGADVNAASNGGHTSLRLATERGHLDIVEVLHARGADIHHVNIYGRSALFGAALYDHLPVCEFLISKGADLMAATKDGRTVLEDYGRGYQPRPPPATLALRRAALEGAWRWVRRGPVLWVLAEHGYRPLQLRAQAIAAAAEGAPLPVVPYSPKEDVLRSEGLVRYIVAFL